MLGIVSTLFDGVAYGMLLFTITVGLSVTMGVMHFTNLAHGAFAMAGAYAAAVLVGNLGVPFPLALLAVFLATVLVGLGSERALFRHFYKASPLKQVLLTIGLVFMSVAAARWLFGPLSLGIPLPDYLTGSFRLGALSFPVYRTAILVFGLLLAVAFWLCLERTLVGAKLRAAVANAPMAEAVGINVSLLLSVVFGIGAGLAALGGALSVEVLGLTPTYALDHLGLVLIVVIVGGLGSIRGAFLASLVIGVLDNAGKFLLPEVGAFIVYLVAFAILLWRPNGLFPKA